MMKMDERRRNLFARQQEYKALHQYIRLLSVSQEGTAGLLRNALKNDLTPKQRKLIKMYYMDQMTMQDIADELGVNISSVSRVLKRARKTLNASLSYGGRNLLVALDEW
jgi:DNA-directed RNA polymerase specialized sigma24 family protein